MALNPARLQWSDDGTLRSLDYDDIYFQPGQGLAESHYVFLENNHLPSRFQKARAGFCIGELGFGSGLNFLLTARLFTEKAPENAYLHYISIEKHPVTKDDLAHIHAHWPEFRNVSEQLLRQYPPLIEGFHHVHISDRVRLTLLFGDVADMLPQLQATIDAWYLDGFSSAKNPAMWADTLFPMIAEKTGPQGTLATFSAAGGVRRGLAAAGFTVETVKGYGRKRDMTVARIDRKGETSALRRRITVLGAGIAGCAAAHALARRGHDVTLVDRHPACAQETSGNPVAIVYPKLTADRAPMGEFHKAGFCFTRALIEYLQLPSWRETGVLHLALDETEKERHQKILSHHAYPPDFVRDENGLFQPLAGFLSPPEFCASLIENPAIKKIYEFPINRLEETQDGWKILGDKTLEADAVVIALGLGSRTMMDIPLQSLRGQISYLKPTPSSEKIKTVICHDGYITPVEDGLHCIGATFHKEEPGDTAVRTEDHAENLSKLSKNLPDLRLSMEHVSGGRTGYRATTQDKLPLIGPYKNLYLSTGYGAHGMTGAPLGGEIVAAMISGDPLPVARDLMDYLLPERFARRAMRRGKT